jgi:hypothetical protein
LRGSLAARGLLGGDAIHLLSAQPLGVIGSALGGFRRLLPLPLRVEAGLALGGRRRLVLATPLCIDFGLALRGLDRAGSLLDCAASPSIMGRSCATDRGRSECRTLRQASMDDRKPGR